MAQADWARILDHLYRNEGVYFAETELDEIGDDMDRQKKEAQKNNLHQSLLEELSLESGDAESLRRVLVHMENVDLLQRVHEQLFAEIRLTASGFEVAHDREMIQTQNGINLGLLMLTAVLAFTGLIQSLEIMGYGQNPIRIIGVIGGLFLVVLITFSDQINSFISGTW